MYPLPSRINKRHSFNIPALDFHRSKLFTPAPHLSSMSLPFSRDWHYFEFGKVLTVCELKGDQKETTDFEDKEMTEKMGEIVLDRSSQGRQPWYLP